MAYMKNLMMDIWTMWEDGCSIRDISQKMHIPEEWIYNAIELMTDD